MKWGLTLGNQPQNFLGAKWIGKFLKKVSDSKKRIWALRILSLSPHYFIFPDAPEYRGMKNDEYLEAVYKDCVVSREDIARILLSKELKKTDEVIDYGCGPGFLAKAVSPFVKKIYGVDISEGAIECAKILHLSENIEYHTATEEGLKNIADESVDAIYSYAVVQHLTDDVFEIVLGNCHSKLKPGGKLILHIQLPDKVWQTEEGWRKDNSISGKVKYKYGLHCFGRTAEEYKNLVSKHGFTEMEIKDIKGFDAKYDEELESQKLLIAYRSK